MPQLFHELLLNSADSSADRTAVIHRNQFSNYKHIAASALAIAHHLLDLKVQRGDRVAIYLPKQPEAIIATFAASLSGAVFVPVNPLLKPNQVQHIVQDSDSNVLISTAERMQRCHAVT